MAKQVDTSDFDDVMDDFFETHRYDDYGDWRDTPETEDDPDESAQKEVEETAAQAWFKVEKAERIARPFVSFQKNGDSMLQLIAGLHTNRVANFGFTAEAEVLGVTEYAINEQLDSRVCPVCREMHGKKFKVADARRLLDEVVHTSNPEKLKELQPWPKQDKKTVAAIKEMSSKELVRRALHAPPYHAGCRGHFVHVDKVPKLEELDVEEGDTEYVATQDDFRAYGVVPNDVAIAIWNRAIGLPPGDLLAALLQKQPKLLMDEALDAKGMIDASRIGILEMSINEKSLRMELSSKGSLSHFIATYKYAANEIELQIKGGSIVEVEAEVASVMVLADRLELERLLVTSEVIDLSKVAVSESLPPPWSVVSMSTKKLIVARQLDA